MTETQLKKMYQVTGYHKAGFVAEYPEATSEQEALQMVKEILKKMASPFKIKYFDVKEY